jgi:glycine/D-amino acid oxidase-like deaminating enzyme
MIVIGAGICGLAAAYELARRGEEVVVLERGEVEGEQSAGLGRIFRIAHGQARLCALALEAREGWRRWERDLGVHLLGDEQLVVAAPRPAIAPAMSKAGASWRAVSREEIAARLPFCDPPWEHGLLDPAAGSLRIRRALSALASRVELRRAEVIAVGDGTVSLADGSALESDAVLVCAGRWTPELTGCDFGATFSHHVRLTYAADGSAACLIAPEGYGVALGGTGRWAFGMHDGDARIEDADEFAAATRAAHAKLVPRVFPRLGAEPVAEVRCVNLHAPWLDEGGDGWHAVRDGRTLAFMGANLMKFGPVLGDRLARSALAGDVHPDLASP